jgi:hypothetical protein
MHEGIFWTDEGPLQGFGFWMWIWIWIWILFGLKALEIRHRKVPQNMIAGDGHIKNGQMKGQYRSEKIHCNHK